jgi:hypothetical protein
MPDEMAHYACGCFDAELYSSYVSNFVTPLFFTCLLINSIGLGRVRWFSRSFSL